MTRRHSVVSKHWLRILRYNWILKSRDAWPETRSKETNQRPCACLHFQHMFFTAAVIWRAGQRSDTPDTTCARYAPGQSTKQPQTPQVQSLGTQRNQSADSLLLDKVTAVLTKSNSLRRLSSCETKSWRWILVTASGFNGLTSIPSLRHQHVVQARAASRPSCCLSRRTEAISKVTQTD